MEGWAGAASAVETVAEEDAKPLDASSSRIALRARLSATACCFISLMSSRARVEVKDLSELLELLQVCKICCRERRGQEEFEVLEEGERVDLGAR